MQLESREPMAGVRIGLWEWEQTWAGWQHDRGVRCGRRHDFS
jgi:hypothetical protein